MATIYSRILNQYELKNQTVLSARFDEQGEDGQKLDEIELYINLNINQDSTESDFGIINVKFQLEEQIQRQELKNSVRRFHRNNSITRYFFNATEMNGWSHVLIPLKNSAILNIQDEDKYCIIWSLLAQFHPIAESENGHPTRVSKYRHYFNQLNIQGVDFADGFECSDVLRF